MVKQVLYGFSLVLILFLGACSSSSKKQEVDVIPPWFTSPSAHTPEGSLCAAGSGTSAAQADAKSRAELASIFNTRVHSSLKILSSQGAERGFEQSLTKSVEQDVEGVLTGSIISARHQKLSDKGNPIGDAYSFACIHKQQAAIDIKKKINMVDNELRGLARIKSSWGISRTRELLEKRSGLLGPLNLVGGKVGPAPLSLEEAMSWRPGQEERKIIYMGFEPGFPTGIQNYLSDLINSAGHGIGTHPTQANSWLKGSYITSSEHFNVKGFNQYRVLLNLRGYSATGVQLGSFSKEYKVAARDEKQLYELLESKIKEDISSHILSLKLDF